MCLQSFGVKYTGCMSELFLFCGGSLTMSWTVSQQKTSNHNCYIHKTAPETRFSKHDYSMVRANLPSDKEPFLLNLMTKGRSFITLCTQYLASLPQHVVVSFGQEISPQRPKTHGETEGRNLFKSENKLEAPWHVSLLSGKSQEQVSNSPETLWVLGPERFNDIWSTYHTGSPKAWECLLCSRNLQMRNALSSLTPWPIIHFFVQSSMQP